MQEEERKRKRRQDEKFDVPQDCTLHFSHGEQFSSGQACTPSLLWTQCFYRDNIFDSVNNHCGPLFATYTVQNKLKDYVD